MVCNIIGNPNYPVSHIDRPRVSGHSTGETIISLVKYGLDERKKIRNTSAPTIIFQPAADYIERFRKQIVGCCRSAERGTRNWSERRFGPAIRKMRLIRGTALYDIVHIPKLRLSARLTWRSPIQVFEPKTSPEKAKR